MTIFLNNLKRLYRDKFSLITLLILPVIFISFSMFALGGSTPLRIGIIDEDNTQLTAILREELQTNTSILDAKDEEDLRQRLINGRLDYAIKINKGFTQDLIQGKDPWIQTYSLKETNTSAPVRFYIDGFITSAKNIAQAANGSEDAFYKGIELYLSDSVAADFQSIENTERDTKPNTYASLGFLIMFMLYMSTNAATLVLEDKQLKTYDRVLASPITTRRYFAQNLLSFIVTMLLQVSAIFAILIFVFKADMGPSVGNLLALFGIFALTAVALGVAISSFSKDLRQANAMSYLITVPMCMLGGCFWPRDIMPGVLQQLSNFIPVTWALRACEKLLYGGALSSIRAEAGILVLFALVFLILGSNKRVMMSVSNKQ